ncbi:hypothetical protein KQX54_013300 [Cotesia glomerata]|uniref:CCHC-type domain-containing protein n=1 Tax=Cotesia glomerata TaxID=32391 RepID=A0AAV7J064_COTGL|nr:hypothetical protein KQX54_013300 [Cotesia glomerata]
MASMKNYSNALLTEIVPEKDQAIILDAIDGVQIHEYAVVIGTKIGPENLRHLSRISNNRVCIYVATKDIADTLIDIHKTVKPASSITTLRVGLNIPGFQHILSFRRQVYIKPEDVNNIPPLWKIDYDDTTYFIYPSLDAMICFNCKEQGHLARACPTNPNHQGATDSSSQENLPATPLSEESVIPKKPEFPKLPRKLPENNVMMNSSITTSEINAQAHNNKRPRSEGSSQTSLPTQQELFTKPSNVNLKKRAKKVKSRPQFIALPAAIEQVMTSCPTDFPCSFTQLVHFVNDAPKIHSIEEALQKYRLNAAETVVMLQKLYDHLENRQQKFRFTRITTRIEGSVLEDSSS